MKITSQALSALAIAIIAGLAIIAFLRTPTPASATGPFYTNIGYTATTTSVIAVTSSTRILSTTTSPTDPTNSHTRVYASICNPSATPVYLRLDGDKPANANTGYTAVIGATSSFPVCYEITDRNEYNGSVQASSTNQTSVNVSVQEFVQ